MLNIDAVEQLSLFDLKSKSQSRELGQFFTESKTANYMASMLHAIGNVESVKILDAGSGDGILTVSAARHCLKLGNHRVHAVLFEVDKHILSANRCQRTIVSNISENCSLTPILKTINIKALKGSSIKGVRPLL